MTIRSAMSSLFLPCARAAAEMPRWRSRLHASRGCLPHVELAQEPQSRQEHQERPGHVECSGVRRVAACFVGRRRETRRPTRIWRRRWRTQAATNPQTSTATPPISATTRILPELRTPPRRSTASTPSTPKPTSISAPTPTRTPLTAPTLTRMPTPMRTLRVTPPPRARLRPRTRTRLRPRARRCSRPRPPPQLRWKTPGCRRH